MLKPARKWAGFYIFEKTYALKPRYLIFFLLVTLFKVTFCQVSEFDKTRAISSFNLQYNTLNFWPHNDTLIALKKGLFQNIEVDALFSLKGSKNWHWAYKLPQVGVSLNYYNFGNNKVLGNGLGVYPFMIIKLAKSSKLDLNFRYGGGIVYISKIYEANHYPTNIAISTPINILIDFRVNLVYHFNRNIDLQLSALANHISNGAIKKPNYGLNSMGFGVGFTYKLNDAEPIKTPPSNFILKQPYILLTGTGAVKEVGDAGGPKYYPLSLLITYIKPLSSIIELGASLDITYDKSVRFHLRKNGLNYNPPNDDYSIGLSTRLTLPLDKLSIFGDLGIYLYQPNPRFPKVYQRIGTSYSILRNTSIVISLKTHYNIADHIEFGIAFQL